MQFAEFLRVGFSGAGDGDAAAVFVGCVADLELVWELSDLANALMAVPNLISLCLLSGEATKELKKTYHN